MILERKSDEVFHNGVKLTINKQASKGEGNEVVKIDGLEGSNGQKWISLARLKQGENEITCQGREVTVSKKYELTKDEKAEVDKLQAQIDKIVETAKSRYVAKPKLLTPDEIAKLTPEERVALADQIKSYYGL